MFTECWHGVHRVYQVCSPMWDMVSPKSEPSTVWPLSGNTGCSLSVLSLLIYLCQGIFIYLIFKRILIQEKLSHRRDQKIFFLVLRKYCFYDQCVLTPCNTLCPCHSVKSASRKFASIHCELTLWNTVKELGVSKTKILRRPIFVFVITKTKTLLEN